MDNDDAGNGGNIGGGAGSKVSNALPHVSKDDLKDFKKAHDENCDLKLGNINEKIENMESRIKFAIYMSTAVVGLVLIMVQYYLMVAAKGG